MNPVSALKNTKNGVFALITNGVGGNFSIFTVLASIVVNALILPPIYYFFKLIKARYQGSKATYERHNNLLELVGAISNTVSKEGVPIIDPRKEKGVVAGKTSIYRLTCVIGSIISLAFSILSLYSFISSLRFKNQMNAWGISFALLSPLVAAVTIFLQGELVNRDGSKLIKIIAEGIGINRPHSTIRDVNHYEKSELMMDTGQTIIKKPYYYSFVCALSLSFAAFAQLIAVYTLPNTMRIPAFVVCANLCFAFSKLIFDAYYAYQCNIYDEKNRVVVIGDKIQESGTESSDERSLLQIHLAGKVSELREALNTKLNEITGLLKQKVEDKPGAIICRKWLIGKATLLNLALDSLKEPNTLAFLGLAENIADNANIAIHIMHRNALGVGNHKRAIYSTGFNGRNPAIVKAEACPDLTQPLEKGGYIHEFKGGKVKMEDQHLCYDREEAASLMNGEINFCKVCINIGPELTQKAIITLLELVVFALAAKNSGIVSSGAISAIEQAIQEVTTKAEVAMVSPDSLRIDPASFLEQLQEVENAFGFEVAKVA